jgi:hypothetical protein
MYGIPEDKYLYWNSDIQSAFNIWDSIMEIYSINLTFTKTTIKSNADIIVRYHTSSSLMNVEHTWSGAYEYDTSTINVDDYQLMIQSTTNEEFWLSILHEIGHTIGLADVSSLTAQQEGFTSVMVNNVHSAYHSEYPTYDFDKYNIVALYP